MHFFPLLLAGITNRVACIDRSIDRSVDQIHPSIQRMHAMRLSPVCCSRGRRLDKYMYVYNAKQSPLYRVTPSHQWTSEQRHARARGSFLFRLVRSCTYVPTFLPTYLCMCLVVVGLEEFGWRLMLSSFIFFPGAQRLFFVNTFCRLRISTTKKAILFISSGRWRLQNFYDRPTLDSIHPVVGEMHARMHAFW